jgi:hypothetical protein
MSAAYVPGPDVGVTVSPDGSTVYLAHLPEGPLLVLDGVAALVWVEATTAPAAGWLERVAATVSRSAGDIAADVDTFVRDLRARRLLEVTGGEDLDG